MIQEEFYNYMPSVQLCDFTKCLIHKEKFQSYLNLVGNSNGISLRKRSHLKASTDSSNKSSSAKAFRGRKNQKQSSQEEEEKDVNVEEISDEEKEQTDKLKEKLKRSLSSSSVDSSSSIRAFRSCKSRKLSSQEEEKSDVEVEQISDEEKEQSDKVKEKLKRSNSRSSVDFNNESSSVRSFRSCKTRNLSLQEEEEKDVNIEEISDEEKEQIDKVKEKLKVKSKMLESYDRKSTIPECSSDKSFENNKFKKKLIEIKRERNTLGEKCDKIERLLQGIVAELNSESVSVEKRLLNTREKLEKLIGKEVDRDFLRNCWNDSEDLKKSTRSQKVLTNVKRKIAATLSAVADDISDEEKDDEHYKKKTTTKRHKNQSSGKSSKEDRYYDGDFIADDNIDSEEDDDHSVEDGTSTDDDDIGEDDTSYDDKSDESEYGRSEVSRRRVKKEKAKQSKKNRNRKSKASKRRKGVKKKSGESTSNNVRELSEYEKLVQKNLEIKKAFLQSLGIDEIKEEISNSVEALKPKREKRIFKEKFIVPREHSARATKAKCNLSEDTIYRKAMRSAVRELQAAEEIERNLKQKKGFHLPNAREIFVRDMQKNQVGPKISYSSHYLRSKWSKLKTSLKKFYFMVQVYLNEIYGKYDDFTVKTVPPTEQIEAENNIASCVDSLPSIIPEPKTKTHKQPKLPTSRAELIETLYEEDACLQGKFLKGKSISSVFQEFCKNKYKPVQNLTLQMNNRRNRYEKSNQLVQSKNGTKHLVLINNSNNQLVPSDNSTTIQPAQADYRTILPIGPALFTGAASNILILVPVVPSKNTEVTQATQVQCATSILKTKTPEVSPVPTNCDALSVETAESGDKKTEQKPPVVCID